MGKICVECHKLIVHEDRDFCVCLDCLIRHLKREGVYIPTRWDAVRVEHKLERTKKE